MHKPSNLDIATDLMRCVYASFGKLKFEDPNFKTFFNHAIKISNNRKLDPKILERIKKSRDENSDDNKRREDLLTASIFLQNA